MTTNGETTAYSSAFINHLDTYPAIHDGVSYLKDTQYGQKSLSYSQSAYDTLIKPLSPYIAKAQPYAEPYVAKADQLGASALDQLDSRLPIVKEPTDRLKERITASPIYTKASDYISFVYTEKDYAYKVYSDEYAKAGEGKDGYLFAAKAAVTTSIILTANAVSWLTSFLITKKEEVKEVVEEKKAEKTNNGTA